SGHHICNHLISVDGDTGEGEVYAIAVHVIPDGKGGWIDDTMCCRYIDQYRKEADGRWRFAKRVVTYDMRTRQPHVPQADAVEALADASYITLSTRLFQRGSRA
ncbi:MAG: nuclear transport factor 2 family protein, partial [Sphingobium sp.]